MILYIFVKGDLSLWESNALYSAYSLFGMSLVMQVTLVLCLLLKVNFETL